MSQDFVTQSSAFTDSFSNDNIFVVQRPSRRDVSSNIITQRLDAAIVPEWQSAIKFVSQCLSQLFGTINAYKADTGAFFNVCCKINFIRAVRYKPHLSEKLGYSLQCN